MLQGAVDLGVKVPRGGGRGDAAGRGEVGGEGFAAGTGRCGVACLGDKVLGYCHSAMLLPSVDLYAGDMDRAASESLSIQWPPLTIFSRHPSVHGWDCQLHAGHR